MKYTKLSLIASTAIAGMALLSGCGSDSSSTTSPTATTSTTPSAGYFSKVNGKVRVDKSSPKFDVDLDANDTALIDSNSSWIDTDGDGDFNDTKDTKLKFNMKGKKGWKNIHTLTTLALEKNSTNPDLNSGGVDLSNFDPTDTFESVDLNTSEAKINLMKLHKTLSVKLQKNTVAKPNALADFADTNLSLAAADANLSKANANIKAADTDLLEKIIKVVKSANEIKKVTGDTNTSEVDNLLAALDKQDTAGIDDINTKLNVLVTKNTLKLKEPKVAKEVTQNALNIVKAKKDANSTINISDFIPDDIRKIAEKLADVNLSTGTFSENTDVNETALDTINNLETNSTKFDDLNSTLDTLKSETLSDINDSINSEKDAINSLGVAIGLTSNYIMFGNEKATLNSDFDGFTATLDVNSTSTVQDYYHIVLPIDKTLIDKNVTDIPVKLAVEIVRDSNTDQWVRMFLNGGKLTTVANSDANSSTLSVTFGTSSTVAIESNGLANLETQATATIGTPITTTDLDVNVNTIINSLGNSSQIDSQINALNGYLLNSGTYTVSIGMDGNISSPFTTVSIADMNYTGAVGKVTVNYSAPASSGDTNSTTGGDTNSTTGGDTNSTIETPPTPTNIAPTLSSISDVNVTVGDDVNITLNGSDADANTTLTYTTTALPAGLSLSGNVISGTTTASGTTTVTAIVSDGEANATQSFDIVVNAASSTTPVNTIPSGYSETTTTIVTTDDGGNIAKVYVDAQLTKGTGTNEKVDIAITDNDTIGFQVWGDYAGKIIYIELTDGSIYKVDLTSISAGGSLTISNSDKLETTPVTSATIPSGYSETTTTIVTTDDGGNIAKVYVDAQLTKGTGTNEKVDIAITDNDTIGFQVWGDYAGKIIYIELTDGSIYKVDLTSISAGGSLTISNSDKL